MFRNLTMIAALCCVSLSACGPDGGVASAGSKPVTAALPTSNDFIAGMADAALPPPAAISPTAKTTIDDTAVRIAWDALSLAASAADAYVAVKPSVRGTPNAKRFADALDGASTWLTIASRAQRASQAENYRVAMEQANSAIAGAQSAFADMKGNTNGS